MLLSYNGLVRMHQSCFRRSIMSNMIKPMLAATATDEQIRTLLSTFGKMNASPKLDGIRCTIQQGKALSRSLKLIRNEHVQAILGDPALNGLDGELIVGSPTAHDVYRTTTSAIMRTIGIPDFTFWIFDNCKDEHSYTIRRETLHAIHPKVAVLESVVVTNMEELHIYEEACLTAGFEGVILRDPNSMYKHGRATAKQGELVKVKRFTDAEAIIIDVVEFQHNCNEKVTNELGRSQRSSHKENKIPGGKLGAFICEEVATGITFNIGTGFTDELRNQYWHNRSKLIGQTIKYKSFKVGVKDAPRHPVFLGMRDESDLS